MIRPLFATLFLFVLAGCLFGDDTPDVLRFSGETMGTTYNVTVVDPPEALDEAAVQQAITATLEAVNGSMSNWDPQSEVSRFNSSAALEPVPMSEPFATVMALSNDIHDASGARFDVTLAPLIELWGFGTRTPEDEVPPPADINAALDLVGQREVLRMEGDALIKTDDAVSVNLSAIAKGYGVDAVAETLSEAGAARYLVEIGGDLVTRGLNAEDEPWAIGIERPDVAGRVVELVVPVSGYGLASSGDYRNYFEAGGERYSHILDPTTGRPVTHSTASVTVLAENATLADGWATALLVAGAEVGLPLAEAEGLAVLFITREDGAFVTSASRAFSELIGDTTSE
ncbi:FAD:protein FMN transferase [Cognatishimia sp. MH4019]|uniref:FAD:protein FMN transferase n=1 Tax=Cognatishimia sp. MH4019 TaxID=2854030 RepID=UPI001CD4F22D|nr:FAD:protein FMN transferase [Cognatishimia sp. MH4019]